MKKLIIAMLFFAPSLFATTYYVSSLLGNDANNGTSMATPWRTPNRVRIHPTYFSGFSAGDSILFKRGEEFEGDFTGTYTGTSSSPIVIGAYGTGDKPLFWGNVRGNWTAVPGHAGYYKAWLGYNAYGRFAWEYRSGGWHWMYNAVNEGLWPYLTNADSLSKFLSLAPEGYFICSSDTAYVHTTGGVTPIVNVLRSGNTVYGSYVIIRDLQFKNCQMGIQASITDGIIRNITTKNSLGVPIYVWNSRRVLVDSCSIDSSNYTAIYVYLGGNNTIRYNTVRNVVNGVMGIIKSSELCIFGSQGTATTGYTSGVGGNVFEYNYGSNADAFFDSFYNQNDTIRYNRIDTVGTAIWMMGRGLIVNDNIVSASSIRNNDGIRGGHVSGAGSPGDPANRIFNNTFEGVSTYGIQITGNDGGNGQTIISGNIIMGLSVNVQYVGFEQDTAYTKSSNNAYVGFGKWSINSFPSYSLYATLPSFQSATGFESGSTWSETYVPPEPEPVAVRKVLIKRR